MYIWSWQYEIEYNNVYMSTLKVRIKHFKLKVLLSLPLVCEKVMLTLCYLIALSQDGLIDWNTCAVYHYHFSGLDQKLDLYHRLRIDAMNLALLSIPVYHSNMKLNASGQCDVITFCCDVTLTT